MSEPHTGEKPLVDRVARELKDRLADLDRQREPLNKEAEKLRAAVDALQQAGLAPKRRGRPPGRGRS